jgi:hypothetical protein
MTTELVEFSDSIDELRYLDDFVVAPVAELSELLCTKSCGDVVVSVLSPTALFAMCCCSGSWWDALTVEISCG